MTTYATASSREQPVHPSSVEVRSLITGGLLLLVLFLLLFAPVVGVRPDEVLGWWLRDSLQGLTASLAAVVGVVCLLRWRVASDAQARYIGLAMALYGAGTLGTIDVDQLLSGGGTTAGTLATLQQISRLVVIALLGHALLVPGVGGWWNAVRTVLVTLMTSIALTTLLHASPAPSLGDALPGLLLFGLGITYVVLGVHDGRHLFAWTGVMLVGLALAELAMTMPVLVSSMFPLEALCSAALLLGVLGSYRDVQQAFATQRHRMLASHVTALEAEALACGLRTAQEERAHEASSALLAIEGATKTLARYRDLVDGDTRKTLAAALQAEIIRLRTLLDHAPTAQRPTSFAVGEALSSVVVCANAGGMLVACAIAPDLHAWGSAPYTAQAVQQLLVNADRHAPGSPVEITAECDGDSVVVRVADRGPGVARHLCERIFERGHRSAASSRIGGRGFGLAIARQLIDGQGGALWYEDRPGGGACFTLRLPAKRNSASCRTTFHQNWG
ncbi:MAG: sensor histidine kinase [Egibacteraceae bacterium]